MKRGMITVRDVDKDVLQKFKVKSMEEKMKMGQAMTEAMKEWIKKEERGIKPNPKNLVQLESIIKTKQSVRWSEEIDEFLCGDKNDFS